MVFSIDECQLETVCNWDPFDNTHSSEVVTMHMYHFMGPPNGREQPVSALAEALDLQHPHPVKLCHDLPEIGEGRSVKNFKRIPLVTFDINFQEHVIAIRMTIFMQ